MKGNVFILVALGLLGLSVLGSKKLKPIFETVIYPDEFAGQGYDDNSYTA